MFYEKYERSILSSFNVQNFLEEGLELPIFYGELFNNNSYEDSFGDFYLVKTKFDFQRDVLISNKTRSGEIKFDFDDSEVLMNFYSKITEYESQIKNFILKKDYHRIAFLGIPSSEEGVYNVPQYLARKLNPSQNIELIRTESKEATHTQYGESRQTTYDELTKGLSLCNCESHWWNKYDYIILIDDVVTTGSSFSMVNKFLVNKGIPSYKIVNYALYKYQSVDNWNEILRCAMNCSSFNSSELIDGVIWDFDETIVDSRKRDVEFEKNIAEYRKLKKGNPIFSDGRTFYDAPCKYEVYSELEEVFNHLSDRSIPYAIVSNRSYIMNNLFYQRELNTKVFPVETKGEICFYSKNDWGNYAGSEWVFRTLKKDNISGSHTKPSPLTVNHAIKKNKRDF